MTEKTNCGCIFKDGKPFDECAYHVHLNGEILEYKKYLKDLRQFIADDAKATSYQSLGQYRTALLRFW